MSKDFFKRFLALVRLRYKLIWAHARTGNGKIAMLFALYLIGGFVALFFALGGMGIGFAITSIEPERAEYFARWMLFGLFVNSIGLSLLFGTGTRAAFSEEVLRRYPLDARERFLVRQIIGILDPIWLLLIACTYGLAIGFLWLGGGSIFRTLLTTTIFIVANYLATIVLLTIVGMVMETRRGSGVIGTVVLLVVSFGPLAIALLINSRKAFVWNAMDQLLKFTPPGAAAGVLLGDTAANVIGSFILLLLWCLALLWMLEKLETRPQTTAPATTANMVWQDYTDQVSKLFGHRYAPLVSKALRYHLRCNMIRFSLITAPVIVLAGKYMIPHKGQQGYFAISLAMFFIMSSATAAAMMLNAFGYDEAGIRRYAFMPINFADALRAMNLSSLLLRAVAVFISFALWLIFYSSQVISWQMLVMMLSTALASLFFYNALGFWTSIFSPKSMDFDAMWNNRLSFGANVVVIGGVLVPFWGLMMAANRLGLMTFLRFWWVPLLLMAACAGLYAFSFYAIENPLNTRRERLINLIAGARD
ncbi:MAG: hypothetical protein SF097_02090 [Acidobacteriota bacterium]|nr:hypothetical protein [Acidobacteriota bacterium]